jgi:hypothetical protein
MKTNVSASGTWKNIGAASGKFVIYDATCSPPAATTPVAVSNKQCGITSTSKEGGATLETIDTAKIGSFGVKSLAECKAKCKFFAGYCASYVYNGFGTGTPSGTCNIYSVAIESPGAYENMNTTGDKMWYAYDAGC